MTLVDHLEGHLGQFVEGWKSDPPTGVQVVRFANQPFPQASTFVTLGLSHHVLDQGDDAKAALELLLPAWDDTDRWAVVSLLGSFAHLVVEKHHAPPRGTVSNLDYFIPGGRMSAVYVSLPVTFPKSFWIYEGVSPPVVLVWLIPIHPEETGYVATHGWKAFEDLLESPDPDLLDFNRKPVVEEGHAVI